MISASSTVTTSDPSWSTATTQATAPQWQSQEQYQQYYQQYYQAMSQASVASTTPNATPAADPNAAYTQDYSKAWDEYYKAYYGQSYAVTATPTQYPTSGYTYDQYGYPNLAAPPPTYNYESVTTQATYQYAQPPVTTTSNAYSYTEPSNPVQSSAVWSESQTSYEKPNTYNSTQSYQQSYDKPPPSFDKGNSYSNEKKSNNVQNDSYLERFPPPPFDTGSKPSYGNRGGNYRGRGGNDNNFRRPQRGQGNRGPSQRGNFNDRSQFDERTSYTNNNRSQYNNYEQSEYNNDYQSNGSAPRGRGGRPPFRSRGGEQFRGRGGTAFRGRNDYEFNNKRSVTGEYKQGYDNNQHYNNQDWNTGENFNHNNFVDTNESMWNEENDSESSEWNNYGKRPMHFNSQDTIRPMPLMDLVVRPSGQSSIVMRRQALIDKWQSAIQNICEMPIQHYWATVKSALSSDVQHLLLPSFVKSGNAVQCELNLDDIFLVQSNGIDEDSAIEESGKIMWQMLQNKLYVRTSSRGMGVDKVPIFCVSNSDTGPVSVPPGLCSSIISHGNTANNDENDWIDTQSSNLKEHWSFDENESESVTNIDKPKESEAIMHSTAPPSQSKLTSQNSPSAPPQVSQIQQAPSQVQISHNFAADDIFIVIDSVQNEKDQSISILNNTAKFNKITIEYKHEKPENATHISQCLITINGQHFEKSEARDYLVAKREAADKAVAIFKLSCPQIEFNVDRATELNKADIVSPGKSIEEASCDWLKKIAVSEDDNIYRLSQSFTIAERDTIIKMAANLNLSTKQENKGVILIFKQFPIEEMKSRLLKHGYCAQYRLYGNESIDNKSV